MKKIYIFYDSKMTVAGCVVKTTDAYPPKTGKDCECFKTSCCGKTLHDLSRPALSCSGSDVRNPAAAGPFGRLALGQGTVSSTEVNQRRAFTGTGEPLHPADQDGMIAAGQRLFAQTFEHRQRIDQGRRAQFGRQQVEAIERMFTGTRQP